MYFPHLRGKQYELIALRECAAKLASGGKVVPIIEPVRSNIQQLSKTVKLYTDKAIPFVLVINPQCGELAGNSVMLEAALASGRLPLHSNASLGFIISEHTTIRDVETALKKHHEYNLSFIHSHSFAGPKLLAAEFGRHTNIGYQIFWEHKTGHTYRDTFSTYQRVLIKDGFTKLRRNADYPADEFFLDLHKTYKKDGFYGFGDFAIVGVEHDETGGPAHAVVIHLTYQHDDGDIWIRHFVSDSTTTTLNVGGKFAEALAKLINFLNKNPKIPSCIACDQFRALQARGHFPQLGPVKKLSIEHHIELMNSII
ncbi:MAG: hypothetical protein QOJ70_533 [Acidobacteriota bacterium]|jgi:hypothetical protein|nr:hypothetical protein [Acidobacteriota bacterium]